MSHVLVIRVPDHLLTALAPASAQARRSTTLLSVSAQRAAAFDGPAVRACHGLSTMLLGRAEPLWVVHKCASWCSEGRSEGSEISPIWVRFRVFGLFWVNLSVSADLSLLVMCL